MRFLLANVCAIVVVALSLPGCSGVSQKKSGQAASPHLTAILSLYNYCKSNTGRPPANEAEFKQFVAKNGAAIMEAMHVASSDEFFVSERDGEPFVIVYGKRPKGVGEDVIAYEHTGVDGTRLVAFGIG